MKSGINIQKMCFWLVNAVKILLILNPIYSLLRWFYPQSSFYKILFSYENFDYQNIVSLQAKLLGVTSDLFNYLPILIGGVLLIKVLKSFSNQYFFNESNTLVFQRLGWLCLADGFFFQIISDTLFVLAKTFDKPVGERILSISIGTPSIKSALFACALIILAGVMQQGNKLMQDNELTV